MYGLVAGAMLNGIEAGKEHAKMRAEKRNLMRSTLSPEDFEKWEKELIEERRHQEICRAIRETKPNRSDSSGAGYGVLGFLLGASLFGD